MTFAGQVAIGAGLTTLYYPVAYAKVLIQVGNLETTFHFKHCKIVVALIN